MSFLREFLRDRYAEHPFPSEWADRLSDPSEKIRSEAARDVPLGLLSSAGLYHLFKDPSPTVMRAVLHNPSLDPQIADEIYRWIVAQMALSTSGFIRVGEMIEALRLRGFSCPAAEAREIQEQIRKNRDQLKSNHERLEVLLFIESEAVTPDFLRELWPLASSRQDTAAQWVAHPRAEPELWRMAAAEVFGHPVGDIGRAMSEVFLRRPASLQIREVQDLIIRFGSARARMVLMMEGPVSLFRDMLRASLVSIREEGTQPLETALRTASLEQLRRLVDADWQALLALESADVRLEAIRARGRLSAEPAVGDSEQRPEPPASRSGRVR